MPIRNPDRELVEDLVREAADDTTGILNLPHERDYIQREYKERVEGKLNASSVSHNDIRSVLDDFSSDENKDIEHITDEAYYINPFVNLDESGRDSIQKTITDIYQMHVVFDKESIRESFEIPRGYEDFFIETLEERHDLIKRLTRRRDVFTIGDQLEQKTDASGVEERIRYEAGNDGIITNSRFEKIISAPAIDEVIQLFENKDYVIDLDGEYLVRKATDDHGEAIADKIHDDIVDEFNQSDHLLLESTFENVVERKAKEASRALPKVPNETLEREIVDATKKKLRENLSLKTADAAGESVVVMADVFEEEINDQARNIYSTISSADYRIAAQYVEAADERIEDLSVEGGETTNQYFREQVRERVYEMIRSDFGRGGDNTDE